MITAVFVLSFVVLVLLVAVCLLSAECDNLRGELAELYKKAAKTEEAGIICAKMLETEQLTNRAAAAVWRREANTLRAANRELMERCGEETEID